MIRVLSVVDASPAAGAGIHPGDAIVSINGEPVIDEIDYQALIVHPHLEIVLSGPDGTQRAVTVAKSRWDSLGLVLDETVVMKPRHCRNHCVFCFIDQMPPGMRKSLYVKDDDWRLSLMMGNYVTLTNVDDAEFVRILKRNASPLYISVHATDGEVRCRMLRNPNAGNILERLTALKNHGIIYTSFKYGSFEGERNGRFFMDMDEEKFSSFVTEFPELSIEEQWVASDVRPGREDEKWLNLILRKNV